VVRDHFLNERSRNRRFLVSVKQVTLSVVGGVFYLKKNKKKPKKTTNNNQNVFIPQWRPVHFQKKVQETPSF